MFWGEDMKMIHTADWHLGKVLNGQSFLEDQSFILDEFIKKVEKECPDVVIIAGDIFDTTMPNKRAITLMEKTIAQINIEMGIPTVIINGNHDGKARLRYGSNWFQKNELFIRTEIEDFLNPIQFDNMRIFTMPFFTLAEARQYLDVTLTTYEDAVAQLIAMIKPKLDASFHNILVGHFTVYGAPKSDSEREITVGTIESVAPSILEGFDAVMLGHIHHPFALNQSNIYYSGSLLQYSFSEVNQPKGFRSFQFLDGEMTQRFIQLMPKRKLSFVETSFHNAIHGKFSFDHQEDYFHFHLSELEFVKDPMQQLKQQFPNTLALTQQVKEISSQERATKNIKKMKPMEIVNSFYKDLTEESLDDVQEKNITSFLNHYGEEQ